MSLCHTYNSEEGRGERRPIEGGKREGERREGRGRERGGGREEEGCVEKGRMMKGRIRMKVEERRENRR